MMELMTYFDIAPFYQRALPFLVAREAEHNLILGICSELLSQSSSNRTDSNPSPYLAVIEENGEVLAMAVRTPPHHLVLSLFQGDEAPDAALGLLADRLSMEQLDLSGIVAAPQLAKEFAIRWRRRTGHSYQLAEHQRIYQLQVVRPVAGVPGTLRRADQSHQNLLVKWRAAFAAEALHEPEHLPAAESWVAQLWRSSQREVHLWEDGGRPVSLVGSTGPTPNGMRIAPVYTPPALRGHGYASACTAAVSQLWLDSGKRFCFLFTDLANPTSNHVYQQIGYEPVADVDVYRFLS